MHEFDKIKMYHYRLYDDKKRPVISVCLIRETVPSGENYYHRGIAICAKLDYGNLRIKRGYEIARGRALKALNSRLNSGYITRFYPMSMISKYAPDLGWYTKSCFCAIPTPHENYIMEGIDNKIEEKAGRIAA